MSEEISQLTRTSPLSEVIETINKLVNIRNEHTEMLGSLSETSLGKKVAYTATGDVYVSGEVYVVETSGLYQVETSGKGSTHFLIDNKATGEITRHNEIQDDWKSQVMLLSAGDKVIFWSTPEPDETVDITLTMVGNFYTMLQEFMKTYYETSQKVDQLLQEYTSANAHMSELVAKADMILNNHTNQVAQFQADLRQISERIKVLP